MSDILLLKQERSSRFSSIVPWLVFRNIIHTSSDCMGDGFLHSYTSSLCNIDEDLENLNISEEAEITLESP